MNSSFYNYLISRESKDHYMMHSQIYSNTRHIYRYYPNEYYFWSKEFSRIEYKLTIYFRFSKEYMFHKNYRHIIIVKYGDVRINIKDVYVKHFHEEITGDILNEKVNLFNRYLKYSDSIR